jgi:hypothetical protein
MKSPRRRRDTGAPMYWMIWLVVMVSIPLLAAIWQLYNENRA